MNQEDPRSDLWTFLVGSPNRIQLPSLSNINDSRHISQTSTISKKIYPTPVKHPRSQKKPYTCQTSTISKKYPTPVKHPRSQKNTLHLSNIRDLKK